MLATKLTQTPHLSATLYRCEAGPGAKPYAEAHDSYSFAFVRKGSFGYINRGRHFDMVPGAFLIGRPGEEYTCTHDHHDGGDECLCFKLAPALVEEAGGASQYGGWQHGALAPRADFMVLGELADATAAGKTDLALEEVGLAILGKMAAAGRDDGHGCERIRAQDRKRIVDAAHWIDARAHEDIDLATAGRESGLSAFHFLRLFARIVGATPHQYLIRARLRRAARLLAESDQPITDIAYDIGFGDLSNFVRTFGRAAGLSPREFRRRAHAAGTGQRKILQDRVRTAG
ncbi:helix-turn-helix domain-containing protein [Dongia rigui]|uniref:AraC family transcriptional regulator n=1 Tax=Dongia rigui TaxID=940149 RepID=A0ABU5DUZ4_9PROT|nr:AraC family transcriptional regulator [Dongia rigui]MDY0871154.1 AraC family transcriptional regulator [Dongia rigui]